MHKIIAVSPTLYDQSPFPTFNLGRPMTMVVTSYEVEIWKCVSEMRKFYKEARQAQERFAQGTFPTFRIPRTPEEQRHAMFKRITPYELELWRALEEVKKRDK